MPRIPVGVQLFSVRDAAKKDLPGTLRRVGELGYKGIELLQASCEGVGSASAMLSMLDDAGLTCCGCHVKLSAFEGDAFQRTVDFFQALGVRHLTIAQVPLDQRKSRNGLLALARTFSNLAERLLPYDLDVGYHNHFDEFLPLKDVAGTPWNFLFDHCSDKFMMQLDLGNALRSGEELDLPGIIRRYPARSKVVHLKPYKTDADPNDPRAGMCFPIGQDSVPWADVFDACEDAGGTEWYVVEYGNGFDDVRDCLLALREMGKV